MRSEHAQVKLQTGDASSTLDGTAVVSCCHYRVGELQLLKGAAPMLSNMMESFSPVFHKTMLLPVLH